MFFLNGNHSMTLFRFFFLLLLYCFLLISCSYTEIGDNYLINSGKDKRSLDAVSQALNAPELVKFMYLETLPSYSYTNYDQVNFLLKPGQQKLYGGIRSELAIDYPYKKGEKVRYKFSLKIPKDFIHDLNNRWWLVAQWHDQPDPNLGQTWKGFPSNSPPISMFLKAVNGSVGVGVNYMGNNNFWFKLTPDEWHIFTFDILWSKGLDGNLILTIDGSNTREYKGKNMLNDYQHYLKIGMYRHPNINSFNRVSFKELSIEHIH